MSRRILLQAIFDDTIHVVHEPSDDVESFIWVLSYSVLRNLYGRACGRSASKEVKDERISLRETFNAAFGQTIPRNITTQRQSRSDGLIFPRYFNIKNIIASFMSDALKSLFDDLSELVDVQSVFDPRCSSTSLTKPSTVCQRKLNSYSLAYIFAVGM
jgi:hypothetical protein